MSLSITKTITNSGLRKLLVNVSWLGGGQLTTRILRLITIIVVARLMLPENYGIAALILATNELFHSVSHGAVSSKLVQASDAEVNTLKTTVYSMSWILALMLAIIQSLLAWPMAEFYQQSALIAPLCLLSLGYLLLPTATVQSAMLIREGRLGVVARAEVMQALTESILIVVLAIAGFGFWALVLPKLLVVPVWVIYIRAHYAYKPKTSFSYKGWRSILKFGIPVALNDSLLALRTYFSAGVIGGTLGIEALGIFYFAMNAGLGISMSLVRVLNQALFSHLCSHERVNQGLSNLVEFRSVIFFGLALMIPVILLQSLLAPYYVPLLFGEQWQHAGAIPVLILLCVSALPLPIASVASQSLRAMGHVTIDLYAQLLFTMLFMVSISIGIFWGLQGVAIAFVFANLLFSPVFALFVWNRLRKNILRSAAFY